LKGKKKERSGDCFFLGNHVAKGDRGRVFLPHASRTGEKKRVTLPPLCSFLSEERGKRGDSAPYLTNSAHSALSTRRGRRERREERPLLTPPNLPKVLVGGGKEEVNLP